MTAHDRHAMTAREQAIEAGARALAAALGTEERHALHTWETEAAAVIAAAEPIIRADERDHAFWSASMAAERAAVAEEIAKAIEAECPHGRIFGDPGAACYRCTGAAAIARRFKEAQP